MKEILKKAQKEHYALGAFNFSTAEILKATVLAAKELSSPIIVATSEGEGGFIGFREAAALVGVWREAAKLPIILNLDHGKNLDIIKKAVAAGYDAVHFDGSGLSYKENIEQTSKAVKYIREYSKTFDRDVIIEGEIGYLRGASSLHQEKLEIKESDLTSPEQALDFIEQTGVDSLAIVIGNAHGVFAAGEEKLHLDRLAAIKKEVGDKVFLVLHGGSGIPAEDVKKAIELGIVKVNINTELRLAYKAGLEKEFAASPSETTPYKMLQPSIDEVKKVVMEKIKLFGSENKININN
ncbi:MAG TPA: class II fructose-bisphosphate aldolase [Candidatus Portnoybacteria bacterium]|nr:class II fructose-bisphosphate aldolase [Candidatus Portnoybacteria bacterium]